MTASNIPPTKGEILKAVQPHVAFDGWSEKALEAAAHDLGRDVAELHRILPRGATELAIEYHRTGDDAMAHALAEADLSEMRFRDRIAHAVRLRLEATPDREVVRRGVALFSLPHLAPDGARLIWETADRIWTELGDTSEDYNWYTKRALLSGVYSSTVMFWLGDQSEGHTATWTFLDRRIADVMQIEKLKSDLGANPLFKAATAPAAWLLGQVRAPTRMPKVDLPGNLGGFRR